VQQWVPRGSILTDQPAEWLDGYLRKYEGARCTATDFVDADGANSYDLQLAARSAASDPDGVVYCPRRKALAAMSSVTIMVTNQPLAFLREHHLSGTHPWRHIGAIVTERAGWPDKESCVVGDWAPPADPGEAPPKRKRGCTVQVYTKYATMLRQLAIRKRYLGLLRTAFKLYESVQPLSWDTAWEDLLPLAPEDETLKVRWALVGPFPPSPPPFERGWGSYN